MSRPAARASRDGIWACAPGVVTVCSLPPAARRVQYLNTMLSARMPHFVPGSAWAPETVWRILWETHERTGTALARRKARKGGFMADFDKVLGDIISSIAGEMKIDASTLSAGTTLESLDISSIEFLDLMFAVEEKVGGSLDINTVEGLETLGDLAKAVQEQLAGQSEQSA